MIGPDKSYYETHNAYLDAIDELSIVRLLNLDLDVYDTAILQKVIVKDHQYVRKDYAERNRL